jgi:hypothetical protein
MIIPCAAGKKPSSMTAFFISAAAEQNCRPAAVFRDLQTPEAQHSIVRACFAS